MIPIVLHIPHASRLIPAEERAAFVLDDAALERELTAMTDAWTDELIEMSEMYKVRRVVAPVSRLVCDVERFRDEPQFSGGGQATERCSFARFGFEDHDFHVPLPLS